MWRPKVCSCFLCDTMSAATRYCQKMVSQTKQTDYTPHFRPKWQNLYPISDKKCLKMIPFGVAHTYMAYIWEYPFTPKLKSRGGEDIETQSLKFSDPLASHSGFWLVVGSWKNFQSPPPCFLIYLLPIDAMDNKKPMSIWQHYWKRGNKWKLYHQKWKISHLQGLWSAFWSGELNARCVKAVLS